MLCEACQKNQANVHIIQIINGKKHESNLCEVCASKVNSSFFLGEDNISLPSFLGDMFGKMFVMQQTSQTFEGVVSACPSCGQRFNEIGKSGKLGCSDCYKAFEEELEPNLRRIQGNGVHVGKIPLRNGEQAVQRKKMGLLKQALQDAIASEQYEKAAEIRDHIKTMEKDMEGKGGGL